LPRVTGHSFRKALGSQGRRAFFNTQTQGRRAAGQRLEPAKNLSRNCDLLVAYLLDIYILKVFLIITKGNRTMRFNYTNKNSLVFSVDLSLGDIETEIDILKEIASDEKHPLYFSAMQQLKKYENLLAEAERSARNQFAS
jgi:hypothetical protein